MMMISDWVTDENPRKPRRLPSRDTVLTEGESMVNRLGYVPSREEDCVLVCEGLTPPGGVAVR